MEISIEVMETITKYSEEAELEKLKLSFPGLTSFFPDRQTAVLQGCIQLEENWFRVRLILPKFPKIDGFTLFTPYNQEYIKFTSEDLPAPLTNDLVDLITKVPQMLNDYKQKNPIDAVDLKDATCPEQNINRLIYAEIAGLFDPQSYEIQLNKNYTYIKFQNFTNFEQHYLEMKLPSLDVVKHSLPDGVPWIELFQQRCFSLTSYLQQFEKAMKDVQCFYDELNCIDELCHVIEPSKPTTNDNWRLILLRKNVYLKLVIGYPPVPVSGMSIQIIGPTYEVEKLRKIYSDGIEDWDYELDIQKNLLRIFDLCFFPMFSDNNKEEEEQCCSICLCYRMEDNVPIISCDNPKCDIVFHPECLKHWFSTLTTGKEFLDVSFGNCPYCKMSLSAAFKELLEN